MRRSGADEHRSEQREFVLTRNGVQLSARLWLPAGAPPFPCVVFAHGLGSSKDSPRNVVIAARLVDAGIAALLFDLSGHGDSTGDPGDGERAYVDDLACAFAWAQAQPELDRDRIGIAGSSLGAVIAIDAVMDRRVRPAAMVLRAPPVGPHDLAQLGVPSLALVGSEDPLFERVRAAAKESAAVRLCVVPGAGHLFEEPGTLEVALEQTVTWFRQRLGVAAGDPAVRRPAS